MPRHRDTYDDEIEEHYDQARRDKQRPQKPAGGPPQKAQQTPRRTSVFRTDLDVTRGTLTQSAFVDLAATNVTLSFPSALHLRYGKRTKSSSLRDVASESDDQTRLASFCTQDTARQSQQRYPHEGMASRETTSVLSEVQHKKMHQQVRADELVIVPVLDQGSPYKSTVGLA